MALRVVGAGLGRTGTTSLKAALEKLLGEPCYHMFEVGSHPEHPGMWASGYRGSPTDWDTLFAGYGACVDWPAAGLWQPISEAYPDALIVLSLRDADSWWRSASTTIFKISEQAYFGEDAEDNDWTAMMVAMLTSFTPHWREEGPAKAAFEAHNESVRNTAPADRLLVWQATDGWEPLCERLGVPVPDEPFPHANTGEEMRAQFGLD
ncbi:MAG: sulfotransferase family protein [Mycobacteriales bacterium]